MSASTQETRQERRQRHSAPEAQQAEPASASNGSNGATMPDTRTVVITSKTGGDSTAVSVSLPNKFSNLVGQPLTPDWIKIIFAHVSSQFRNNQNANAEARFKKYAKAQAEGNTAEMAANAPLTVDQYLTIWSTYLPEVGGGPRMGSLERMRYDAAWDAWLAVFAEHNASVKAGTGKVIPNGVDKTTGEPIELANPTFRITMPDGTVKRYGSTPSQTKGMTDEVHAGLVEQFNTAKDAMIAKIQSTSWIADRVEAAYQLALAKRGKAKETVTTATTPDQEDLL